MAEVFRKSGDNLFQGAKAPSGGGGSANRILSPKPPALGTAAVSRAMATFLTPSRSSKKVSPESPLQLNNPQVWGGGLLSSARFP
jgi:hypothetical protein